MSKYILNQNQQDSDSGENYELHNEDTCHHLPDHSNRLAVGNYGNCHDAKRRAKELYPSKSADIDGCYYCCNDCHNE